ncbi:MAG: exonuclease SbcCD subunit D C-terminal domain-containing protein [Proteobacteria bacterium]|nr:exonuclease SbcCD subunit D C-terminal domain-containing protein [Pseudomonadota bacterium]
MAELLANPDPDRSREDYLCAHLTDTEPVLDPMARLREVYPNMLELQFARPASGNSAAHAGGDHRSRQPEDLFRAFYRDMLGQEVGEAALAVFNTTANTVAGNREESAS